MVNFRSMEINHSEVAPGVVIVNIAGRVMMGPETERITSLVSDLLRDAKRLIIFDISGIKGIDSTGIGHFISSYNQVAAAGGEMRIAAAPNFVFKAFHICGLDRVFRFYPSIDEARKAE